MAKTTAKKTQTVSAEQVAEAASAFINLLSQYNGGVAAVAAEEPEEEPEEDEEEEVELTREMVEEAVAEGIKALRELAESVGIEHKKKADILAAFEELLPEEEEEEDEDEDEDEDDEEDEDGEEEEEDEDEYSREDLEEMDLKELRKIAKAEGHSASDYRGLDQDALIDLILGEEAEEEDEDEEDEESDEEVEELDEDALNEMSQKELLGLAKEIGVKVPKALQKPSKTNHKKIVALILDSGEEEE